MFLEPHVRLRGAEPPSTLGIQSIASLRPKFQRMYLMKDQSSVMFRFEGSAPALRIDCRACLLVHLVLARTLLEESLLPTTHLD